MDNRGEKCSADNDWSLNPRPPVIIQLSRPSLALQFPRFTLPGWRLILVAALASAVGTMAATLWPMAHHRQPDPVATAGLAGHGLVGEKLARDNEALIAGDHANRNAATIRLAERSSAGISSALCHVNFQAPQLVVNVPPILLRADEPALLGVTVDGSDDGAQLVICGHAAKSVFSAGQSIDEKTWTLPASEIADATIIPPRGFVGPMKLALALVNSDKSLADRRTLQLQWLPQTPATPSLATTSRKVDAVEVNRLLEEGLRLKAAGDLADARMIFSRIAQTDSRAAFMLAETYDPISLAKRRLLPADSDLEQARIWYRRAFTLGSQEASGRLERLANW